MTKYNDAGATLLGLHGCKFSVQSLGTICPQAVPVQAPTLIAPLPPTEIRSGNGAWPAYRCDTVHFNPLQLHCTFGEGVREICPKSGIAAKTKRIIFRMGLFGRSVLGVLAYSLNSKPK